MVFERAARAFAETMKFERTRRVLRSFVGAELIVELAQYREFQWRRVRPVDQRVVLVFRPCVAALYGSECGLRRFRAEHRGGIDMRDVEPQARRWRIGAEAFRLRAEHRVRRTDRERMRAALRTLLRE